MYIVRKEEIDDSQHLSLRQMLSLFLKENGITSSALAEEVKVHRDTLDKFLKGESELKFMQAVRVMKILGLTDKQFITAYCKDENTNEETSFEKLEEISYVAKNFDIPILKKMGIIRAKAKIEEYSQCICSFFGFSSIYEYDDTSLLPTLFSKSKRKILEEKESKMTTFWVKCAVSSFMKIDNPNEFDRNLLVQLIKRASEFTHDEVNGYYRFVLVLFQIGITVITQPYASGTNAYGGTMIVKGKPCIVITDKGKQYHKLWISLLHELYHVVNDYEILESLVYHFSTPEMPNLLLNEDKADQFALDVLINPVIQKELGQVVLFPFKVKALSESLSVSPSIIYGVYLESLPNGTTKSKMFAKFNHCGLLSSSEVAVKNILFDPISKRSLLEAIDNMKERLYKKII